MSQLFKPRSWTLLRRARIYIVARVRDGDRILRRVSASSASRARRRVAPPAVSSREPPAPTHVPGRARGLFPWTILDRDDALPDRPSPSSSLVGTPIRAPRDAARASPLARAFASPSSRDASIGAHRRRPLRRPRGGFSNPGRARVLLRRDRWDGTRFDLDDVFPSRPCGADSHERIAADATRAAKQGISPPSSRAVRLARERPASSASPHDRVRTDRVRVGSEYESDPDSKRVALRRRVRRRRSRHRVARARKSDGRRGESKGPSPFHLSYVLARGDTRVFCSGTQLTRARHRSERSRRRMADARAPRARRRRRWRRSPRRWSSIRVGM